MPEVSEQSAGQATGQAAGQAEGQVQQRVSPQPPKPVEHEKGPELKKSLSGFAILMITINSIMGTGIYFLPAIGVSIAGPASLISWLMLSGLAIYIAMCFAELASMFPKSGGVFEYAKQAYGRSVSFFIGWIAIITSTITIAMLIVGSLEYLLEVHKPALTLPLALTFAIIFHIIAYRGIRLSAIVLLIFAMLALTTFGSLIFAGLPSINLDNFVPFLPAELGWGAIFVAIFLIAETFFGWESATFLAEETKNSAKALPRALIWATIIIAVISIMLVIVSIGNIPWREFGQSARPLTDLSIAIFGPIGGKVFRFAIGLTILGAAASWIVSAPRLILSLTNNRLFLLHFRSIHPKYNSPYKAIMFQAVITVLMLSVGAGSYRLLLSLLVPLVLIVYSAILLGVVVLRYRRPELKRAFRVPFGKVGPVMVVAIFIVLIINWSQNVDGAIDLLTFGASFVLIGVPLYFLIEVYNDQHTIMRVEDATSRFNMMFENLILPPKVKREIKYFLGGLEGKHILDYGCNAVSLTTYLAEEAGPLGRVYSVDHSKNKLKLLKRKILFKEWDEFQKPFGKIVVLHDKDVLTRIHPDIGKIHAAVSVNSLSNVQNVEKVIREIGNIMEEDGKLCFVECVNYFGIIPNPHWLREKTIRDIFRKAGFSIQLVKKKAMFWDYLYIYGVKSKEAYV